MTLSGNPPHRTGRIIWGILCAVGGWALFLLPSIYALVVIALGNYTMSSSSTTSDWSTPATMAGAIAALIGMVTAPLVLGMAVANRRRIYWITGACFAVPALIGAGICYFMLIRDMLG